jgi:hypothetical protein
MNADGDQAVYHVTPPAGMSGDEPRGSATVLPFIQVVFRKIDGKWYLSQGPGSLLSVVPPDEHGD